MSQVTSTIWRALAYGGRGEPLPKGLDAVWDWLVGMTGRIVPRRRWLLKQALLIDARSKTYSDMSDAHLRERAAELRAMFRCGRQKHNDVIEAFAVVREICVRTTGMKPFLVQLAGGLAIYLGYITEMATGEGKTLTATLPASIRGWVGKGCHVLTVNDYLAQRDAETMKPIYEFSGLHVSYITGQMHPPERRAAYAADITYCTNKEVCADYLRDQLSMGRLRGSGSASSILSNIVEGGAGTDRLVMRGLEFAIVDEADSILIDEAVTPLIISGEVPNTEQVEAFQQAVDIAARLIPDEHFSVNHKYREVDFTDAGKDFIEEAAEPLGGIWAGARRREELVNQALVARELYTLNKQYVIQEGKIVIVDEFTGRLMPDRTWRDGLHQAVEAKETLTVNPPKETFARISFQRFFRMYRQLSGMTGTATESVAEMWQIYHRPVVVIPTNRPCVRKTYRDRIYATEEAKFAAVADKIQELHKTGQPVLVGTRSVRASEHLSDLLGEKGLMHEVLNAVRHKEEAQIVSRAGQPGAITVATNMAGRGTDIKLGKGVQDLGGLFVLATERHEAGRVDRQLFGRCARQGDPGHAQAFVSLEDELVLRHAAMGSTQTKRMVGNTTRDISNSLTRSLFAFAQKKAEIMALRQRKSVLKTDNWLDEFLGFAGKET